MWLIKKIVWLIREKKLRKWTMIYQEEKKVDQSRKKLWLIARTKVWLMTKKLRKWTLIYQEKKFKGFRPFMV